MLDLSQYIVDELPQHDLLISEIDEAITRTHELFGKISFREDAWGYRVLDEDAEKFRGEQATVGKLSQSTVSMITASLVRGENSSRFQASSGFPWKHFPIKKIRHNPELDDRILSALKKLSTAWSEEREGPKVNSTTYGGNDILSISWHYDLFRTQLAQENIPESSDIVADCKAILLERAEKYVKAPSGYMGICEAFKSTPVAQDARIGDSSYILLRFVRCLKALANEMKDEKNGNLHSAMSRAAKRIQSKLHDQLSLAEITDSRFDPAELAFCLEGLLHLKPEQVDHLLLERAIAVLERAQEQSAYWRSETPIVIQQRGHVLFPIGVEVARSILTSIALFIVSSRRHSFSHDEQARHLALLKRYWAWLKIRRVSIKFKGNFLNGWHSEHINDTSLIHTWETSQILEFLLSFKAVLTAQVSRQLLLLSRLEVRYPKKRVEWDTVIDHFEPCSKSPYDIYRQIGTDFIAPRLSEKANAPLNWSMLLYGPPGTGKSTIAENMADCLRVPVITITVSDFLGEGESRMESRVKNIFSVIERQSGAIVLFDEMDQFLLDRNSELFRTQDSVFQFLTPGMLTKLAKLRRSEEVIFIIATNFEERIDPAIKRAGRIDHRYLVLPPDNARREKILRTNSRYSRLIENATAEQLESLLESSCLLAYTDIVRIIPSHDNSTESLIEAFNNAPRNVHFATVADRFKNSQSRGFETEIVGLIKIIDEAQTGRLSVASPWDGNEEFRNFIANLDRVSRLKEVCNELEAAKDNRRKRKN